MRNVLGRIRKVPVQQQAMAGLVEATMLCHVPRWHTEDWISGRRRQARRGIMSAGTGQQLVLCRDGLHRPDADAQTLHVRGHPPHVGSRINGDNHGDN